MKPFEQVVSEHGPTVLRVCRAMLGPTDAEDAWSETFLAALKSYPDLDEGANVEAWLVRIAHRKAIDTTRATARRPVVVDRVPERPSGTGRPGESDLDLWDALGTLPTKQRAAVVYHYVAGLPYKEIASITGSTAAAVRRAAADGVRALRETYLPLSTAEGGTRS